MLQKSRPVTAASCAPLHHLQQHAAADKNYEQPFTPAAAAVNNASNIVDHEYHEHQLHELAVEPHSPSSPSSSSSSDLSLLSLDKQPFYLRLLQRDNSGHGMSRRRLTPSFVPFLWELSPGLPKPNWLISLPSSVSPDDHHPQAQDHAAAGAAGAAIYNSSFVTSMPPLAPPPFMQQISSAYYSADRHGRRRLLQNMWLNIPAAAYIKDLCHLKAKLKIAFGDRTGISIRAGDQNRMLLLGGGSSSRDHDDADDGCSPRSTLMGYNSCGSSSDSGDSYQLSRSATTTARLRSLGRGGERHSRAQIQGSLLANRPKVPLSSWLNNKTKMKSCCCFHMSKCET